MPSRYYRRSTRMSRPKRSYDWIRQVYQPTVNATLMNVDLFSGYRTAAGITINLPEITIWRIHLAISIKVTTAAVLAANDAVHLTVFTDSQAQTPLSQSSNPLDQRDMMWHTLYLTENLVTGSGDGGAGTFYLYKELDIRAKRRFRATQDTCYLQLSATGQPQITDVSVSQSILVVRR